MAIAKGSLCSRCRRGLCSQLQVVQDDAWSMACLAGHVAEVWPWVLVNQAEDEQAAISSQCMYADTLRCNVVSCARHALSEQV